MVRALSEEELKDIEDFAFYESGLSSHGCLENLDSYTIDAITKYGRLILKQYNEIIIYEK